MGSIGGPIAGGRAANERNKPPRHPCRLEIVPPEGTPDIKFEEGNPSTIVVHAFAPKGHADNGFKFIGKVDVKNNKGETIETVDANSNSKDWECAKNWAPFWKDGKTMAPNYHPAKEVDANPETPAEDSTTSRSTKIWVNDHEQHHITCVFVARGCSKEATNDDTPCSLSESPDPKFDRAKFDIAPKISSEAGEHPPGTTRPYESLDLASVKDVGDMKLLGTGGEIDNLLNKAEEEHDNMQGTIRQACAGPLCEGIYSGF